MSGIKNIAKNIFGINQKQPQQAEIFDVNSQNQINPQNQINTQNANIYNDNFNQNNMNQINYNQQNDQINYQSVNNLGFEDSVAKYQNDIISKKDMSQGYSSPMNQNYQGTNNYNQNQNFNNYNNPQVNNMNYSQPMMNNNYQPQMNQRVQSQAGYEIPYVNPNYNPQGYQSPEMRVYPRRQRKPNQYYNDNMYEQPALDFDRIDAIDYGNYNYEVQQPQNQWASQQNHWNQQQMNQYNRDNYSQSMNNYQQTNFGYENYINQNNMINYGYDQYSDNNQFFGQGYQNQNSQNNFLGTANNYDNYAREPYSKRLQRADLIPVEIAREIRSEKLRNAIMFLFGLVGIITTSLMLVIYYKTSSEDQAFMGVKRNQVLYPFFSIFFLLISSFFWFISITDYSLLVSNVKKYIISLVNGQEQVPYFITRNYRSLLARSIYINWIAFSTYIVGSISLGILYGFQSIYNNHKDEKIMFFFWEIGKMKSFQTDITINIIVLFVTLGGHILNIVSSRNRKNNIIGYYGFEILPQTEIIAIKKKANKRCLIIFIVVVCLILFLIIIPWLIIRKKKGKSLNPWRRVAS
ncbi:hypothetical protein SHELI_v1c03020 [Spiroplasma helicoides]|uniref:Transmembrane protein n=1 Tax=Spiroplasma helicoides TaxID=216938 RepID=A0A1B3SK09_9MOLU|nr:hypothetical protein [Spiroplasma helicoides]AOG60257.1 hypothetical protein SHELI_v1c03020 [Spiroplasma helicoides]